MNTSASACLVTEEIHVFSCRLMTRGICVSDCADFGPKVSNTHHGTNKRTKDHKNGAAVRARALTQGGQKLLTGFSDNEMDLDSPQGGEPKPVMILGIERD